MSASLSLFPQTFQLSFTLSIKVYVDGTEHGADIDERDTVYMAEMAERGYVAVTVDYGEKGGLYT